MGQTVEGGKKVAVTNKAKYGEDYYVKLGALGGSGSRPETRYFRRNPEAARIAGAIGGRLSKRKKGN